MQYARIYADSEGNSHFETVDVKFFSVDLLPPAPPVGLAGFEPATQISFLSEGPGWRGPLHCAPKRSYYLFLRGEVEIETSDGDKRRFGPGDILRTDDTTGKGHRTHVVSDVPVLVSVVQLAD